MASDIRNYQTAEGLSDEQMAQLLSERLGRPVSAAGYRVVKGRSNPPDAWLEALSIVPREPQAEPVSNATGDDGRADNDSHTQTAGMAVPLPFEPASAAMQITLIYTMAGKGIALSIRRDGTEEAILRAQRVENLWAVNAPAIAAAYIEWAKENATVAHYIAMLTLGGAGGKILLLHGSLLVQTLIESGSIDPEQMLPPSMRGRVPQETDTINEPVHDEQPQPSAPPPRSATKRR